MFTSLLKKFLPVAAIGMGLALSGCDGMNIQIGDSDGVPLSELDMSGPAPTELILAGPDSVILTEGDTLAVEVEGDDDAVASLRFANEDGKFAIMREKNSWSDKGTATIRVTMPLPSEVKIAGSGTATLPGLAKAAEVTLAGSGKAIIADVAATRLELTVAGSGTIEATGTAERLEMTIAGSGSANMAGLQVGDAEITIAGSGDAEFASDGKVEAKIMGSGDVNVTGNATCTVESVGSGSVTCKAAAPVGDAEKPTDAADGSTATEEGA